jgi:hypothetical protein
LAELIYLLGVSVDNTFLLNGSSDYKGQMLVSLSALLTLSRGPD